MWHTQMRGESGWPARSWGGAAPASKTPATRARSTCLRAAAWRASAACLSGAETPRRRTYEHESLLDCRSLRDYTHHTMLIPNSWSN